MRARRASAGSASSPFSAPPSGYLWTTQNAAGSTTDDDSDLNILTHKTAATTLQAGENDPSLDAGLVATAKLGNYVWADNNLNGKQDSSEDGVQNVTVRLLDGTGAQARDDNGVLIPDTLTDVDGLYSFAGLRPGQYEIQFVLPAGYMFTTKDAASTTDMNDSDAIVSGANVGRTAINTLTPNETDNSWDAGFTPLASS